MTFARASTLGRSVLALSLVLLGTPAVLAADESTVFGQSTESEAALIGIFYDLKQTQDHQPSNVTAGNYFAVVDQFLSGGWDEGVLNKYYRIGKPLYTTQIFIPSMNADLAPKAFNADKSVRPSRWIIHYKAQVSPPESGTYRFVGSADDLIAVAVNGKTELAAPLYQLSSKALPLTNWKTSEPSGQYPGGATLASGDWVTLKKDDVVDLDVIIGERPGGNFNAYLMIEKQGETYARDAKGHLILPIFQVAPFDTPPAKGQNQPLFAKGYPPWKSYQ